MGTLSNRDPSFAHANAQATIQDDGETKQLAVFACFSGLCVNGIETVSSVSKP